MMHLESGLFCIQDIVKSMGSGLIRPLIKEVMEKERDSIHCHTVITHLVQVSNKHAIKYESKYCSGWKTMCLL